MPRKHNSKFSHAIKAATFKEKGENRRKAAKFNRKITERAINIPPVNRTALIQAAEKILQDTQAPRLPLTLPAD